MSKMSESQKESASGFGCCLVGMGISFLVLLFIMILSGGWDAPVEGTSTIIMGIAILVGCISTFSLIFLIIQEFKTMRGSKIYWVSVLVILSLIGLIIGGKIQDRKKMAAKWAAEEATQRAIMNEVRDLFSNCRFAGNKIEIIGKVLVWDMDYNSESAVNYKLKIASIAKSSSDKPVTVFMLKERSEKVGNYSISGQSAYRKYVDIAVAYWPEKKAVGFHSIVSEDPRSWRPVRDKPEYGDVYGPVVTWIDSLADLKNYIIPFIPTDVPKIPMTVKAQKPDAPEIPLAMKIPKLDIYKIPKPEKSWFEKYGVPIVVIFVIGILFIWVLISIIKDIVQRVRG